MISKTPIFIGSFVVVAAVGWYLFRPELLFINTSVNESFPSSVQPASNGMSPASGRPTPISSGKFHSGAHETKGEAAIFADAGGKRVLRLSNFETSNGPDVRVLLIAASDATDNDMVKNAMPVELGKLKGNIGDQNYEVPADLDLDKYHAVTIWCNRFGVNFGTAPLTRAESMSDSVPVGGYKSLGSGAFHSNAHETKGTATVYESSEGDRILRLTGFETSNGPDVRVLLIAAADAADSETVKNSTPLELGKLKGNVGDQNYQIPKNVDLNKYRAVTIWCNRFGVNFGTAPIR